MAPKLRIGLVAIASSVALDQGSKTLVARELYYGERVAVLGGFFSLTHLRNSAASFGLFAYGDASLRRGFFIAASLAGIALWLFMFRRIAHQDRRTSLALGLILGGAIGNLIDRAFRGAVVDFLDLRLGAYTWPAFNLADSFVVAGVALLMFMLLRAERATATRAEP